LVLSGALVAARLVQESLAAGMAKTSGTNVTVTLGQPSEHAITLSTNHVPLGTVFFTVTNNGDLGHNFKVCSSPTGSTKPNDCDGEATSILGPGDIAMLKVVFTEAGSFEYLSTRPEPANAVMRGLLNVGAKGQQNTSPEVPPIKLALARKVTACMHSHGFPNYPDNGNSATGSKPSATLANAALKSCERRARKALGLPALRLA
jgi:uncharacterized cupredoxin-like copper-binding protein